MIRVPAGGFLIRAPGAHCADEHGVTLANDFDLGRHEVTNEGYVETLQWPHGHGYVTATSSPVRDNLDGSTLMLLDLFACSEIPFTGCVFTVDGWRGDHPVSCS